MALDATAVAKQLHDQGFEVVPTSDDERLLAVAPSLAPALTDPVFRLDVDRQLSTLWPPDDKWRRIG